ncbi:MAG: sigma-70 family RNA polymerase sigma factor [Chloroflexi bacterium]|nr:sigma-70 family RNA polymerase sigma factor [Chloroflexota bacterium]
MRPAYALAEYCAASPDPDGGNLPLPGRAKVQDLTAFHEIVERLQGKIFSVSYALLGSVPEADATAQKVFVRLYRTARPVARPDLIQYAYRLAIDQCLIELRLRHARRFFAWFTSSAAVPDRGGLAPIDECRERDLALRYLAMLPRRERALLVLREVAGQPVEGIAQIMDMKPGAVRKHLFSARRRLLRIVPAVNQQARLS